MTLRRRARPITRPGPLGIAWPHLTPTRSGGETGGFARPKPRSIPWMNRRPDPEGAPLGRAAIQVSIAPPRHPLLRARRCERRPGARSASFRRKLRGFVGRPQSQSMSRTGRPLSCLPQASEVRLETGHSPPGVERGSLHRIRKTRPRQCRISITRTARSTLLKGGMM
jgi:hypothetical protein